MAIAFSSLLQAIAETMLEEPVNHQEDIAECAKEFFNVVCGYIVAEIFKATKAKARFQCPQFAEGYFLPEDGGADVLMTACYQCEQHEPVVFLHDQLVLN